MLCRIARLPARTMAQNPFGRLRRRKNEENSMKKILCGLTAFAGVMGACGVAAAAAAAHLPGGARLSGVALVLLAHAAAVLNLATRAGDPGGSPRFWLAAGLALAFGSALFSGDVTLLTLRGIRLFPMAAPTGGMTMIVGWLLVGLAAMIDFARSYR
jgi:uncharacterized membrane protein YgdD (TMEM256/DUF423 family)